MDFAGAVRGQDHARRPLSLDGADLRDRDLEVRQDLEQVRLELLVRAVDLVDQQHRRDTVGRFKRLEQRALDQELRRKDVMGGGLLRGAARLEQPDLQHLPRVVPLVHGRVHVQALVALEANELRAEAGREHLRQLRLADARLALEEQRSLELEREEHRGRERPIGDVPALSKRGLHPRDGAEIGGGRLHGGPTIHEPPPPPAPAAPERRASGPRTTRGAYDRGGHARWFQPNGTNAVATRIVAGRVRQSRAIVG